MLRPYLKTFIILLFASWLFGLQTAAHAHVSSKAIPWWEFQSVDTMKYSRDISREFLAKQTELKDIADEQAHAISHTGATHIGIATPYDEEFLPILRIWVTAARDHNLKVWFRGNWSGWEGWFDYPSIDRTQHLEMTRQFIAKNSQLFEDGDVFTACPECENGGHGDPRLTGDTQGFRQFLIDEHTMMETAFADIEKNVTFNFNSMNGDVAKLVMDTETTAALGGVVTIDHYVSTPEKLAADIKKLAKDSGGLIVLGEFGAPIPDIHGKMSEKQQADWIASALAALAPLHEVIGVSYWTNQGGSTELWTSPDEPKQGVLSLSTYYTPIVKHGVVRSSTGREIKSAKVTSMYKTVYTDKNGEFSLPTINSSGEITVTKDEYAEQTMPLSDLQNGSVIVLQEPHRSLWQLFTRWLEQVQTSLRRFLD